MLFTVVLLNIEWKGKVQLCHEGLRNLSSNTIFGGHSSTSVKNASIPIPPIPPTWYVAMDQLVMLPDKRESISPTSHPHITQSI